MARPAPRLRVASISNKSRKAEPARPSHRFRQVESKAGRGRRRTKALFVKAARGGKKARFEVAAPKRNARSRGRPAEATKLVAAAQAEKAPPDNAKDDPTANIRDIYLAHRRAAEPVSVISLVRPVEDRPQLPDPEDVAATPQILPALRSSLYDEHGRLMMPAALRGSHEILVHQNEVADRDGVGRVQDDDALTEMRRRAMLVALPVSGAMQVDGRLPADRRFCRPWTANFLAVLARAHYARFHTALQVNSAVRTVAIQRRLLRTNGNAAPIAGETASPHLTGQAVDIAKRGLSPPEIAWLRGYLLPLIEAGKIDVEEEFQQSCFHISVYKKYLPSGPLPEEIAVTHRDRPAALAIMLH